MKRYFLQTALCVLLGSIVMTSCSDQTKDMLIPYPNDITFNDIKLDRFSYKIPDAPFRAGDEKSGTITVNVNKGSDGTFSGFALSNKNWRSYPWSLSPDFAPAVPLTEQQKQAAIDSCIFSVFTPTPNKTETYLVGRVKDDDAFITLNTPAIVEHILVANTTYNYLLDYYGSVYSGTLNNSTQAYSISGTPVKNIQIANTSTDFYGRFYLPGPGGKDLIRLEGDEILAKAKAGKEAADKARNDGKTADEAAADSTDAADAVSKGYVKLTIDGFNNKTPTGSVEFLLAARPGVDPAHPDWDFVMDNWNVVDLTSLGTVDKLVFHLSSSYTDNAGNMLTPPYFCLDGIRLKK